MSLDTTYLGQNFKADTLFKDTSDDPIVPLFPAQWTVYDFNNNKVLSGIGAQDANNGYLWTADVQIPESVPASTTKKYRIEWTVRSNKGNFANTEYFTVLSPESFDVTEVDTVFVQGDPLQDNLVVPARDTVSDFRISIMDSDGYLLVSQDATPCYVIRDNAKIYNIQVHQTQDMIATLKPYVIGWQYKQNEMLKREYHFVYIIQPRTLYYMEQLRNYIDKIRFSHPNPNLRFNDVDLLGYLVQGVQMINGTKPQPTAFDLTNVPTSFEWYLINAAAYVGLSAQYLAEGQQAFDFSGQTVSLNVDRTQAIDSFLGRIQDIITTQLVETKTMYAKSNARPVLGLSPSPCINPKYLALRYYGGSDDPGYLMGSRSDSYQDVVSLLS